MPAGRVMLRRSSRWSVVGSPRAIGVRVSGHAKSQCGIDPSATLRMTKRGEGKSRRACLGLLQYETLCASFHERSEVGLFFHSRRLVFRFTSPPSGEKKKGCIFRAKRGLLVFLSAIGRLSGFLNAKRETLFVPHPPFITSHPERSRRIYLQ